VTAERRQRNSMGERKKDVDKQCSTQVLPGGEPD